MHLPCKFISIDETLFKVAAMSGPTSSDDIEVTAADLRSRGKFMDAICLLKEHIARRPRDPSISVELAETYIQQGYLNQAHETILTFIRTGYPNSDKIQMLKCSIEPLINGSFTACASQAEEIMQKYNSASTAELCQKGVVRHATYLTPIVLTIPIEQHRVVSLQNHDLVSCLPSFRLPDQL